MKKLIAILTITIVLVGAVFATVPEKTDANGSAVIDITTTIAKKFPAYKLSATGVTVSAGSVTTADSVVANTDPTPGVVSINEDELLTKNATVSFSIIQTQFSRAVVIYKIGVTATALEMKKDADGNDYTGTIDAGHSFALASGSATPAITGNPSSVAHVTVSGTNAGIANHGVTASYDGVKVAAGTVIGTFSCTWEANDAAAPGQYEATVTLAIEAQ